MGMVEQQRYQKPLDHLCVSERQTFIVCTSVTCCLLSHERDHNLYTSVNLFHLVWYEGSSLRYSPPYQTVFFRDKGMLSWWTRNLNSYK